MKISIPQPCHENWNEMLPQEKGRFCHSCQKSVTDFTKLSDKEILEIVQKPNQCGRFSNGQLERINRRLKEEDQIRFPSIFRYSTLIIGLGLGGTLFSQEICTPIASIEQIKTESKEKILNNSIIIEGKILDLDGFPVYQTRVGINGKGNRIYTRNTDKTGYFKLEIPDSVKFNKLFVDSEYGYGEYEIKNETNQNLKITLENYTVVKESMVLGGMVIKGNPITQHKSFTGKILHTLAWPFCQIGKLF
jgi:hypothetical protein